MNNYSTFVIFVLLLQLLMSYKVVLTLEVCSELIPQPTNGRIEYRISKENKTIATLSCNDGYRIVGYDSIECDGKWSNQIGTCVESTSSTFKIDDLNTTENEHISTGFNKDAILRALDNSSGSLDSEDDAEIDEDDSNYSDVSSDNNNVTNSSVNTTISTPTTIASNGTTFTTMNPNNTTDSSANNIATNSSMNTTVSTPTTIANNGTTFTTMSTDSTTDSSTTNDSESSTTITSDATTSSSTTNDSVSATGSSSSSSSTNSPDTTIGGNTANNNDTINSTMKPFPNAGIRIYVSCSEVLYYLLFINIFSFSFTQYII